MRLIFLLAQVSHSFKCGHLGDMKTNCLSALLAIAGMFLSVSACNSKDALLSVRDAAVDQPAPLGGSGGAVASGSPDASVGAPSTRKLSAGEFHTCTVLADGRVLCWGRGGLGQPGDGGATQSSTPVEVAGIVAEEVAAGGGQNCDIHEAPTTCPPCVHQVCCPFPNWKHGACLEYVMLGGAHSCARMSDGAVRCWGSNLAGALGVMEGAWIQTWTTMPLLSDVSALQVVAGDDHTCARTSSGAVSCWGYDGVSHFGEDAPFTTFADLAAVEITAGGGHSCARNGNGQVFCWGLNDYGELGDGTTTYNLEPSAVPGLSAAGIAAGGGHTCARKSDGTVACWGDNWSGQLGDGTRVNRGLPVVVDGLTGVVEIAAGERHTCARKSDGTVACWGANEAGQLGDGSTVDRGQPAAVSGLAAAVEITAGAQHSCARLSDGRVVCWGANDSGQLGNGTTASSASPVEVLLPGRGDAGAAAGGSDASDGSKTIITLDRNCYDSCVSYSILIDGNGRVTYVGRELVKLVGTAYDQIPVSDVQELVREMEQANYFNLTASWSCPQDFPGTSLVTTSLTVAGVTHIVYDENACAPTGLMTIEDRIDAVAHSAQWVKCDTPDGTCPVGATGGSADGAVPGTGDAGAALGTPKSFLIVNATANTVYVDLGHPVQCRTQDASGWQACEFFGIWCLPTCQYLPSGGQCCVQCEQEVPSLFAVPAGGNRTVVWAGSLFAERTGYCSDCSCREQSVVRQGTFEATVRAYAQYSCAGGQPCPEQADGTIPYAAPQGSFEEYAVQFAVPSASEVVVIIIPGRTSAPDAATINAGLCGNGRIEPGEECDDGNTVSGDGCSASCQVEPGWH